MFDTDAVVVPGASAAAVLAAVVPESLSDLDLVAYAQAAERQVAYATAVSLRASLVLAERAQAQARDRLSEDGAGARSVRAGEAAVLVERAGVGEVQQALRLSVPATQNRLHRARALQPGGPLALAGAALRAGEISFVHVLVLLEHTTGLPADLVTWMQQRCLPRAGAQTPGNFGKSLVRARHALDPAGSSTAHRQARADTGVRVHEHCDGMSALVITATSPQIQWAFTLLDTLGRAARRTCTANGVLGTPSAGAHPVPTLDQLRAEAFLDLLDRAGSDPNFPTEHGKVRIETQVVLTLPTLLGLRADPATINGQSVPAKIARELASGTTALRRLVTDPVTGHLLDYGTREHPPAALTEFLLARDKTCRLPHCNIRASATDLDHVLPRSRGGATSSTNMGALSRGHHSPKTAGLTDITDSRPDGSATYITVLGQRIPIPPRPVLEPPAPDPEPPPPDSTWPPNSGPPPF